MPTDWTHIKVPREIKEQLRVITQRLEAARQTGQVDPTEFPSEVTLWQTVARLIEHYENRRKRRSKAASGKKRVKGQVAGDR